MTSKRTRLLMGLSVAIMLSVLCTSMVTAISPQQAKYENNLLMVAGNSLSYTFQNKNQLSISAKNYFPAVNITANITYDITAVTGDKISVTEHIFNINVSAPFVNVSHKPFVAEYASSVKMNTFLLDFQNEVAANRALNSTAFLIASHGTKNVTINNTSSFLLNGTSGITNYVVLYKNNNSAVPQAGYPTVINMFIVSSNMSGLVSNYTAINNTSPLTMKVVRFGMFYTPLALAMAGQNGSFWMNQAWNMSYTKFGLWASNNIANQSMVFNENQTYSTGITGGNVRWVGKFSCGYAKVGGYEQAFYDSQTGILLSYDSKQTRWDGYVNTDYYSNVQPQKITFTLIDASSALKALLITSNATQGIPGYPVVALLVALGIGVILARRKLKH